MAGFWAWVPGSCDLTMNIDETEYENPFDGDTGSTIAEFSINTGSQNKIF